MVDYSRFDKMVQDLSDSDSDERRNVNVTKLEKPSAVTITGREDRNTASSNTINPQAESQKESSAAQPIRSITFVKEGSKTKEELMKDGADNGTFLWSQTADEVIIRVRCPNGTKAKDVNVSLTSSAQLIVICKGNTVLCGTLVHDVWDTDKLATDEERYNKGMTWELEDSTCEACRYVVVKLFKRPPGERVKMWWRRVFKEGSEHEVDVNSISSRNKANTEAFQKVWNEAHGIFLANRARERAEREAAEQQGQNDIVK